MLIKSAPIWTLACSGDSTAYSAASVWSRPGLKPGGAVANGDADVRPGEAPAGGQGSAFGMRLRDLRIEQRVQDEQVRTVFEHLDDISTQAPATAHKGAPRTGGVSGPYPWRRPV
ncbi:hypothetical protein AGRA3207_005957 [Actinomadura graeca]|uniref:Uncharacterized protein n=1 Tax=Actinomadura graeca TaxID=2750812 RepID=A0ABX8R0J8_9ACTN|nr:hypothetical protein [Actinomadura graeca]QXJ24601.1 hypothetical protein AGRA3207_005957 [Actinomadura graeca]